jgi:hypothetical protein
MDISQLGPHLTPVLAIAVLVSLIKPFLERRVPTTNPLHDPAIRLLAVGLGVLGALLDYALNTHVATGAELENALGSGLVAGVGAILTHHLVAGDMFSGSTAANT